MLLRTLLMLFCLSFALTMHELGHYIVARWCGIKVRKFSILLDFGFHIFSSHDRWFVRLFPRMMKRAELVIGWLPLAAYVRFETEGEDMPHDALYQKAKAWKRLLVTAAGPFTNYLVCLVLTIVLVWHYNPGASKPVVIKYGTEMVNHNVARMIPSMCKRSVKESNAKRRGGWYQMVSHYPKDLDLPRLLDQTIFLNLFMMLFNLIPVPPLDGGNMLFCAYEVVLRRKPNETLRVCLTLLGFAALAILSLWEIIKDLALYF